MVLRNAAHLNDAVILHSKYYALSLEFIAGLEATSLVYICFHFVRRSAPAALLGPQGALLHACLVEVFPLLGGRMSSRKIQGLGLIGFCPFWKEMGNQS